MPVVNNPPANAGDARDKGSVPGLGRSPGRGHGNPLQDSCLENATDREVWRAAVHGVAKGQTGLRWLSRAEHSLFTPRVDWFPSLWGQFWELGQVRSWLQSRCHGVNIFPLVGVSLSLFFYFFFIFTLFYFTILYWFCHTLTWIHPESVLEHSSSLRETCTLHQ